jgi:hypothetical protein
LGKKTILPQFTTSNNFLKYAQAIVENLLN